ncbi:MAG: peptide chain release factor N(5)-glutamine methyltransferase [Candidatus Rokuibacteriota bacterium]
MSAPRPAAARSVLEAATSRLAAAGIETARIDAEWLLAGVLGVRRAETLARLDGDLSEPLARQFREAVDRRAQREPLQQILGWEEFHGLRLTLTADVMVPRPETEQLVEWALALLPRPGGHAPLAIDLGTGSGCIACALAAERPDLQVVAVDASPAAVSIAVRNVTALGLRSRITVAVSDLFSVLGRMWADLIVANPPYLPTMVLAGLTPEVTTWEPRLALDGGADGLHLIRRIVAEAPAWLAPGGALVLETAGGGQVAAAVCLLRGAGFVDVATRADLAGVERFVAARLFSPRPYPWRRAQQLSHQSPELVLCQPA